MDINFNDEELEIEEKENVTISKQQRNGRKCWTIIENFANKLDDKDDVKKFLKHVKKTKCCNGSIKDNNVIRLQGDCVEFIKGLLVEKYNYSDDESKILYF
jgi:translation initiation factor SUI1